MVFNAGRFAAFADWFRAPQSRSAAQSAPVFDRARFHRDIPTATGVGHAGDDLIIHALASALPGRPIENPRQRAAYRYSRKYGPLPPCFARATLVPGTADSQRSLLIGGTASVCGEASVHADDLVAQTAETFRNLDALICAAGGTGVNALRSLRAITPTPTTASRCATPWPATCGRSTRTCQSNGSTPRCAAPT